MMNFAENLRPAHHLELANEPATLALAHALARGLQDQQAGIEAQGFVLTLSGDLGSGKTTLVRAVLGQLGVVGRIKSPSYALLEPYRLGRLHLNHFDFYRFRDAAEFDGAGFAEHFGAARVCFIEWPEKAGTRLPMPDLALALEPGLGPQARTLTLRSGSDTGCRCISRILSETAGA
jgi:tRNA threonylcarbamoyladenosine biosynthesis protein TsaE